MSSPCGSSKNRDVSDLDLILTTVGLDFEISCPSVTVSVLLDPRTLRKFGVR